MGIPKFYKWLSERYPHINQLTNSQIKPEFDCMYLDMNGIIHNCTHGDGPDEKSKLSEEQMFANIFKYLDKLFSIARPKKLLFMAIDGVAPRAKMNQQRQRRFRAAKDAAEQREELRRKGEVVDEGSIFDSNCITPGTEFMAKLGTQIRFFIRKKMKEDQAWQRVKVIFSGADVPGEGEHKIMLYIRNMKMQPGYEPNLRHCLYGLDADLIMLSLVSHEPHFALLREEVVFGNSRLPRKQLKKLDEFQFLHISVLREYLDLEMQSAGLPQALPFPYSLERIIDDWVLLAMLVGNDFLPHLPTLDIGEGGLDQLIQIYKDILPTLGGYITHHGNMDVSRLEAIFRRMGELEESVFKERQKAALDLERKSHRNRGAVVEIEPDELFEGEEASSDELSSEDEEKEAKSADEPKKKKKEKAGPKIIDSQLNMLKVGATHTEVDAQTGQTKTVPTTFKYRYYREKFPEFYDVGVRSDSIGSDIELTHDSEENVRLLVKNYLEGLLWTLKYYFEGCRSWKWFFQFRYAPLASDMINLKDIKIEFSLGVPFKPIEQLLGVLPPASAKFLPAAYRDLMAVDSAVADFYPRDFDIDMNGKRSPWEGIALIPFIDEKRLLKAVHSIDDKRLSDAERLRNHRYGDEYLIEYDISNKENVPSPIILFASIIESSSRETVWHLPEIAITAEEIEQKKKQDAEDAKNGTDDNATAPRFAGKFIPELTSGVIMPCPGYPYLRSLPAFAQLQNIGVNVFGMDSKKDSLVVHIGSTENHNARRKGHHNNEHYETGSEHVASSSYPHVPSTLQEAASLYLNQVVFMDWPYLKEASCTRLTDGKVLFTTTGQRALTSSEVEQYLKDVQLISSKMLNTKATSIGKIPFLLGVNVFTKMQRVADGSIKKAFSDEMTLVPAQLVSASIPNPDPRFAELPPPTLEEAFPLFSKVVYTGPSNYGSIGEIVEYGEGQRSVSLRLAVTPTETDFGHTIANGARLQFYPSHLVSKSLGIHPLVLSKICSSINMEPGRADIGLKIKYSKQGMQVPEYARRVVAWRGSGAEKTESEGWEYSEKTVALLAAYKRRFPVLFQYLNDNPDTYKYDARILARLMEEAESEQDQPEKKGDAPDNSKFKKKGRKNNEAQPASPSPASPDAEISRPLSTKKPVDVVNEITHWLTTVGITSLILVPCTSAVLADRGIKAIEQESARQEKVRRTSKPAEAFLRNVPITHLYKPDPVVPWSPTEVEEPELGDRVLSLRSDTGAPFGIRGTIVAIHGKYVEVVFDQEFMSGNNLSSKCSDLRGQTLPLNAILNLSKPKVLNLASTQTNNSSSSQPVAKPQSFPQTAAKEAAPLKPVHGQVQIAKRPAQPAQPAQPESVAAASAAAASAAAPVDSVTSMLKSMLQIGGAPAPAPAPVAPAQPALPTTAAEVAAAGGLDEEEEDESADPMDRILAKRKAKSKAPKSAAPLGNAPVLPPGAGVPPHMYPPAGPFAPVPPPMAYPPHMYPPGAYPPPPMGAPMHYPPPPMGAPMQPPYPPMGAHYPPPPMGAPSQQPPQPQPHPQPPQRR